MVLKFAGTACYVYRRCLYADFGMLIRAIFMINLDYRSRHNFALCRINNYLTKKEEFYSVLLFIFKVIFVIIYTNEYQSKNNNQFYLVRFRGHRDFCCCSIHKVCNWKPQCILQRTYSRNDSSITFCNCFPYRKK